MLCPTHSNPIKSADLKLHFILICPTRGVQPQSQTPGSYSCSLNSLTDIVTFMRQFDKLISVSRISLLIFDSQRSTTINALFVSELLPAIRGHSTCFGKMGENIRYVVSFSIFASDIFTLVHYNLLRLALWWTKFIFAYDVTATDLVLSSNSQTAVHNSIGLRWQFGIAQLLFRPADYAPDQPGKLSASRRTKIQRSTVQFCIVGKTSSHESRLSTAAHLPVFML